MAWYDPVPDANVWLGQQAGKLFENAVPFVTDLYQDTSAYLTDLHGRARQDGLVPTLMNEYFHSGIPQANLQFTDYLLGTDLSDRFNFDDADIRPLFKDVVDSGLDGLGDLIGDVPSAKDPAPTSPGSPRPHLQQPTLNYLNAELAGAYGMDRNTAYQEALSNTAYQRAVLDMQRAGLNPAAIFGSGRGSGASGVAYVGSGQSSTGSGAGSAKSGLFSQDAYHGLAAITGLITAIATKQPGNYYLGQSAAQGVMSALNGLSKAIE